jgi:ubiquinol-cytochrome c reductase cytochrome b subunit
MANTQGTTGVLGWIDERFPLTKMMREHLTEYYAPKNFNFWYFFGGLAILVLVNQILTGIWLTMNYKPPLLMRSLRSNTSCATWTGAG